VKTISRNSCRLATQIPTTFAKENYPFFDKQGSACQKYNYHNHNVNTMKKILIAFTALSACMIFASCSSSDNDDATETIVKKLKDFDNVSLNYNSSRESVNLGRDVESEGGKATLKKGSSWINNIQLSGNMLSFEVEENSNISTGHRFDTILVTVNGSRIGTICVTQARYPFSSTRIVWANTNAMYRNTPLSNSDLSGLEMTKKIYNLEKTTGGKDSYKNYPAFAFCIEMNIDPEHNMEWYLPSQDEICSYAHGQSYSGTPIAKHNYWWSSSENHINGKAYNVSSASIASRGAVSKGEDWWVVAFRNGKIEE